VNVYPVPDGGGAGLVQLVHGLAAGAADPLLLAGE
jgi:hypothetical protein